MDVKGLLVLSRKRGQKIIVEGGIEIVVCEVRGEKVRLGVKAPGRKVHREEIWREIYGEQGE